MRCPSGLTLADLVAGRLGEREERRLTNHFAECGTCRVALGRVRVTQQTMRAVAEASATGPATNPGAARLEATLRWMRIDAADADRTLPRLPRSRGFALSLAAGAALLVGVGGFAVWRTRAPMAGPAMALPTPVVPAAPAPIVPPAPVVPDVLTAVPTLLSGDVRLAAADGESALADPRQPIREHQRIETAAGGRFAFQWGEGSGVELAGGSVLVLSRLEPRAQEFRLERGTVAVRVGPHQPGESLRVVSPDHTVTVHGTWFLVGVEPRGTSVQVLEGVVEVAALKGDGASTRLVAPSKAFFLRGSGVADSERPLTGQQASSLRQATEMGLLGWSLADTVMGTTGLMNITSEPAAQLVVDGVAFGSTPLELRRPRGRHLVELSRPGFTTTREWITVSDEPTSGDLRVSLPREIAESTPPGPDEVQQVMGARRHQISACYERSLKRDPSLAGSVTLQMRIGPAGQVLGTRVESNTLRDELTVSCLRNEAAGWVFKRARNATIVYPFVFRAP